MQQYNCLGGGRVMVWGASRKSALVHIDGTLNSGDYIDNILEPVAIPFGTASIGDGFLYQDDNVRPH